MKRLSLSFLPLIVTMLSLIGCSSDDKVNNASDVNAVFPEMNFTSKKELLGIGNGVSLSKRIPHTSVQELARFFATDKKWFRKSALNDTKKNRCAD